MYFSARTAFMFYCDAEHSNILGSPVMMDVSRFIAFQYFTAFPVELRKTLK